MTLKIDKAGRVVLPKPLRDRLGINQDSDLEVIETTDGVLLKNVSLKPSLIRENGFLVHTGSLPPSYDWNRLVEDERNEQDRRNLGL